ncbi:MerR family transcriptional regulator [Amycolatopsis acidicola]|uniref:MerR family transcriptional regulator n=1 Tax=Amycolatopsis acidicola TaxID=2596893 RepID=A0A5N0UW02_9PSEU|nr:MerR family transcriptional regulator [Amycolatopsis acidicola]KAA9154950.1 MerR family transcriptional regulator [Amycolatopsis acidicola]
MDDVSRTFTIGELARRTGLAVKTIRFYSDEGLLPPTDRTPSGYRLYDARSLARLELIRTLRELGLGLAEITQVLASETTVPRLAARHVAALDEQIHRLRLRRAVLRAVVKRESELEEVKLMNKLASMSDDERARLVDEFWTEMTEGLEVDSGFYDRMRSAKPTLPDDPSPEQVEAWVEFAELIQDPAYRQAVRSMSERHAEVRAAGINPQPLPVHQEKLHSWADRAQALRDAGTPPSSKAAQKLAGELERAAVGLTRPELADRIEQHNDARAERYWQLLGIMNGWPPIPSRADGMAYLVSALRG